jgi:hypothetical protein
MAQPKNPQPLEDRVLTRLLAMPPDPKVAIAKAKKKPAKKPPKK